MKRLYTFIALIGVSLGVCVADAYAADRGPRACGEKRGKIISVAVKDLAKCMATSFGEKRYECEQRAQEKLVRTWRRHDLRYDCGTEALDLAVHAGVALKNLLDGFWQEPAWGLTKDVPPVVGAFNKVVFFAPFCEFGPEDFDSERSYNEAVRDKACFPDPVKEYKADGYFGGLYTTSSHTGQRELAFWRAGSLCQQIAIEADLPLAERNKYDVWLSNEYNGPATRFERSDVPYVLPSGMRVADDWDDLTDLEIRYTIDEDAFGNAMPGKLVMTGTNPDGTPSGLHADNWKFRGSIHTRGSTSNTVIKWTSHNALTVQIADSPENIGHGVYCFQQ